MSRDLTGSTDRELTLWVYNEEYYYIERKNVPYLLALVSEDFIYTEAQKAHLLATLAEEEEEAA